jgi:hypothetical protein
LEIGGGLAMIAGMIIVLLPGMYVRFESLRTRETLLEARSLLRPQAERRPSAVPVASLRLIRSTERWAPLNAAVVRV